MPELWPNMTRLHQELDTLAGFSDTPPPAVTRVLYTDADIKARNYLKTRLAEAGLKIREDPLGNLFARWEGSEPTLPPVATGSHIDAIPHSGRYDGTVGVLGGLEAVRSLQAAGFRPRRSLELVMFTAEEPTRFGVGCLGSRAMAGALSIENLRRLTDAGGKTLKEARTEAGFDGLLEEVRLESNCYHAFVELHIEQGPVLERARIPIGIVTAIAAPATLHVTLEGEGGHAGTVLMKDRKDALVAGAEVAQAVERAALGSIDTVATVGIFDVSPRAVNSIPGRVFLTVDVRDIDLARRDTVVEEIVQGVQDTGARRKIRSSIEIINADPPATCDVGIIQAIEASAQDLQLSTLRMVSRAYHDTLFMASLCPVGMIFIPSKNGVSHRPDEYSAPEDIARGVEVLVHTLARLSS